MLKPGQWGSAAHLSSPFGTPKFMLRTLERSIHTYTAQGQLAKILGLEVEKSPCFRPCPFFTLRKSVKYLLCELCWIKASGTQKKHENSFCITHASIFLFCGRVEILLGVILRALKYKTGNELKLQEDDNWTPVSYFSCSLSHSLSLSHSKCSEDSVI